MGKLKKRTLFILALLLLLFVLPWHYFIGPELTRLPANFSYTADVDSTDNLYDESAQKFSGDRHSVTRFYYEVTDSSSSVIAVKNVFDVRTQGGDKIFSVERLYGIDPKTRKHVADYGDHDRDGYLFAPRHLKEGQQFTYWHINYDGGANMKFVSKETLFGLPVYHYETHYEGVRIDQTKNLTNLPGVPEKRGVILEPYLQLWVEPFTGSLIKYQDQTTAYYYDITTGKRLNPWNKFSNTYTQSSVEKQVKAARKQKFIYHLVETEVPALLILSAISLWLWRIKKAIALIIFSAGVCLLIGLALAM